ncbi:Blue-light-activated histidine kinase 2 [Nitratireductor thuwali]|uniref:histidine kinase n=1 Tax=Nitratireductor thuwali TaxID=2267699 RepID=A0ABY5MPG6_9HYPH|nr:Blue-light-activated histidine kinase 2 [Nitratireductor thuwali]
MDWLLNEPLPTRSWPIWVRYVSTLLLVSAVIALDLWIWPRANAYPFLFCMFAVVAAALLFDRGSGFVALGLCIIALAFLSLEPFNDLAIAQERDVLALFLFSVIGVLTASATEIMHLAVHRLHVGNKLLAKSEREKDILLRDCNHRTRNHLAVLASLARLQEHEAKEPAARAALASIGARVQVMVRVHERLMQVGGKAVVDTHSFIVDLCDDLRDSLMGMRPIGLTVEAESHEIPQTSAVSIGLCINELLTNALKYAFPDDKPGTVGVVFAREGDEYRLTVTDDGVGLIEDGEAKSGGLGRRLVRSLAAQHHGSFEIGRRKDGPGTSASVRVPVERVPR